MTQKHRLFIGGSGGIQPFDMDVVSGTITPTAEATIVDSAGTFLQPSHDGKRVYATTGNGAAAFDVDPETGAVSHINTVETELPGNAHISLPDGGVAVLAAYGGGGINILRIHDDGGLAKPVAGSSVSHGATGSGIDAGRQGSPCPHSAFVDPTGKRVVVSDLGTDKLYCYNVNASACSLERCSTFDSAPGAGPRHLVWHPSGRWIYSINELDCTITVLGYDVRNGALGPKLQTVSTLPEGYDNDHHSSGIALNAEGDPASGPNSSGNMENNSHFGTNVEHAMLSWNQTNTTSDIHTTPDGRFLFGSNRGHDSLVTFAIGEDGTLTLQGWTPTKGHHPRNFGVHPSGQWVLVLNADSDNCVLFHCEPETGTLTQTGIEFAWDGPTVVKWVPLPPVYQPTRPRV